MKGFVFSVPLWLKKGCVRVSSASSAVKKGGAMVGSSS